MLFGKRGERRMMNLGSGSNNVSLQMIDGHLTPVSSGVTSVDAIRNSDIYSCVNLIASDVASANFKTSVPDDNLNRLLSVHPNDIYSPFTFWQTVLVNLLLNGNAFCVIHRDPFTNVPVKLELLINMEVNVMISDDYQSLCYYLNFFDNRKPIMVPSSEILHFRLLAADVNSTLITMGTSPLMSLAQEVQIQNQSNKLTLTSLVKTINPSGILKVNKGLLDKKAKENIRSEFEDANTGSNAGRPLVLDQAVDYKSVSVDENILNLLKGTDWTRAQICKAFGVPSDLLQMESEHSNIAQIMSFYAACLNRYINPVISEITNKLCTQPGEKVTMDVTPITDPDNSAFENRIGGLVKNNVLSADAALALIQQKGGW